MTMNDDRLFEAYIPDMRLFNRLDESAQAMTKNNVLSKLVKSCAARYKFIDFSEFDKSKGDVTKFKYYDTLSESLNLLFSTYKEVKEIALMMDLFQRLHENRKVFKESFLNKNAVGVMIYNTMLLSIFEGTSYIIAAMVDFVDKDGGIDIVIQKMQGTKSKLMVKNLERIQKDYDELIKLVDESNIPGNRMLEAASVGKLVKGALSILTIGFKIIPAIRELLFMYYFARVKISDAAEIQAEFLKANAERLRSQGDDKVAAKQEKFAKFFSKIATKFAINHDKAENTATKEAENENLDDEISL